MVKDYIDFASPMTLSAKYKVGERVVIGKITTDCGSLCDRALRTAYGGQTGTVEAVLNTRSRRYCVRPDNNTSGTLRLNHKELTKC